MNVNSYKLLVGLTNSKQDENKFLELPQDDMKVDAFVENMAVCFFGENCSDSDRELILNEINSFNTDNDNIFSTEEMKAIYNAYGANLDNDNELELSKETFIENVTDDSYTMKDLSQLFDDSPLLEGAYNSFFGDIDVSNYEFKILEDGTITTQTDNFTVKITPDGDVLLNDILYSETSQKNGKTSTELTQCGQIFDEFPNLKTTKWFDSATITGEALGSKGQQGTLIAFAKDGTIQNATSVNSDVIKLLCKNCGFDETKLSNVLKSDGSYNLEKSGSSYVVKQGDKQIYPITSSDFKEDYTNDTVYKELYPNSTSTPEKHTVLDIQKMAEIKAQKFVQELGTRAGNSIDALTLEDLLGRETHYNKAWATQGSIDLGELIWGADNEIIKDMRKTPGNHVNYLIGMEQFQLLEDNNKNCLSALNKKGVNTKDVSYTTPKLGDIVITSNADGTNWHSGWVSSIDYSKNPPTYTVIESNSAVSKDGHGITTRTYTIGDDSEKSIRGFISFSKNEEVAKAYETIEKVQTTPEQKQKIQINFEKFQTMVSDSSKELKFDANNGTYATNGNVLSFETTAQDGTLFNIFFDLTTGEIEKTEKKDGREEKTKVDKDGKETYFVNNQQVQQLDPKKTQVDVIFEDVIKLKDSEIVDMMEKLYPNIINSEFDISQSSDGKEFELVAQDGTVLKITNYSVGTDGKVSFDFASYPSKEATEPDYEAKVEDDEVKSQKVLGFEIVYEDINPINSYPSSMIQIDDSGSINNTTKMSYDELVKIVNLLGNETQKEGLEQLSSQGSFKVAIQGGRVSTIHANV